MLSGATRLLPDLSRPTFLSLSATGILDQIILCGDRCPVHCGMSRGISGLYQLDAS